MALRTIRSARHPKPPPPPPPPSMPLKFVFTVSGMTSDMCTYTSSTSSSVVGASVPEVLGDISGLVMEEDTTALLSAFAQTRWRGKTIIVPRFTLECQTPSLGGVYCVEYCDGMELSGEGACMSQKWTATSAAMAYKHKNPENVLGTTRISRLGQEPLRLQASLAVCRQHVGEHSQTLKL